MGPSSQFASPPFPVHAAASSDKTIRPHAYPAVCDCPMGVEHNVAHPPNVALGTHPANFHSPVPFQDSVAHAAAELSEVMARLSPREARTLLGRLWQRERRAMRKSRFRDEKSASGTGKADPIRWDPQSFLFFLNGALLGILTVINCWGSAHWALH